MSDEPPSLPTRRSPPAPQWSAEPQPLLPPPPSPVPPPPHEVSITDGWRHAPRELRPVVVALGINLALSVLLTVVTLIARHSIVNYQLDHRHIVDPAERDVLRSTYLAGIVGRVVGNVVVSVVYVFLVRALLRGRRWAYRRVILLGVLGIVALALTQTEPYPLWMRIEQALQAVVLAALVWFVTRPGVRAHFAPHLPGRMTKRFGRS